MRPKMENIVESCKASGEICLIVGTTCGRKKVTMDIWFVMPRVVLWGRYFIYKLVERPVTDW